MSARFLIRSVAAVAMCIAVLSCGGGSTPAKKGGVFTVSLSGAQHDDGAILFSVGPGTRTVTVIGSLRVHVASRGNGYHVAALGPLLGSSILSIAMPDANVPPTLAVIQVARGDGTLRTDLTPYALSAVLQP